MIPILYDRHEEDFLSNGFGQLGDCLTCTVTEEINGIYELEFTYPMNGAYYEQLINYGGVVACTHDHNGDVQLFDIYRYEAPIDGIVTFYAAHVSYRLKNWIVASGSLGGSTPNSVFYYLNNQVASHFLFYPEGTFVFTDYSGLSGGENIGVLLPVPLREIMFSRESTEYFKRGFLQNFNGEWQFDRFNVNFYKNRGTDRGVQIRYGKNMAGVSREKDWGSIMSVAIPVWIGGDDFAEFPPVYSPNGETSLAQWVADTVVSNEQMYARILSQDETSLEPMFLRTFLARASVLDITEAFKELPTQEQAREYSLDYMSKNGTWKANDNITVEFLDLYDTPEYENIRGLSDCRLGDFVSVLYPQLGIVSDGNEIKSLTYDVLAERVVEMQLNTIRTTLAQVIVDSMERR